jgi:hypothetical protein
LRRKADMVSAVILLAHKMRPPIFLAGMHERAGMVAINMDAQMDLAGGFVDRAEAGAGLRLERGMGRG